MLFVIVHSKATQLKTFVFNTFLNIKIFSHLSFSANYTLFEHNLILRACIKLLQAAEFSGWFCFFPVPFYIE